MKIEMIGERGIKYDTLVVCSGGLDSMTALYWEIKERNYRSAILTFDHPTRAAGEKECVNWNAGKLNIPVITWKADKLHSSYLGDTFLRQKPCRNLMFASITANIACGMEIPEIAMGIQAVDVEYLDCQEANVYMIKDLIGILTEQKVKLTVPFLKRSKAEIVELGLQLKVPYEHTYSCYEPGPKHCGECHSCKERIEAFAKNGIPIDDPRVLP